METKSIWSKLQSIDSRIIYGLLLVSIIVPLFSVQLASSLPIIPSDESTKFYDTIESVAKSDPNKLIIVDGWWSAGTRGENQWQAQAVLTHLMKRHLKFATLSFDPQNDQLTRGIIDEIKSKYGYVYGVNYICWGYRSSGVALQTIKGIAHDIPGSIHTDWQDKPVESFPVMKGMKNAKDVGAVVEITPSGSVGLWTSFFQKNNQPPILYAPTAVMAPDSFPYLDSGQIAGLMTGVKGAGDYEKLMGTPGMGMRATGALSLVYSLIILLIVVCNVGAAVERSQKRKEEAQ